MAWNPCNVPSASRDVPHGNVSGVVDFMHYLNATLLLTILIYLIPLTRLQVWLMSCFIYFYSYSVFLIIRALCFILNAIFLDS